MKKKFLRLFIIAAIITWYNYILPGILALLALRAGIAMRTSQSVGEAIFFAYAGPILLVLAFATFTSQPREVAKWIQRIVFVLWILSGIIGFLADLFFFKEEIALKAGIVFLLSMIFWWITEFTRRFMEKA